MMLIGHLGDDVKMHYFDDKSCIGRFPIATNETYINKQTNERVTTTEWHNIVVRNKAAEICERYLKKGDKVYVEGRLKTRQWQGEDGQTRYTTEIQVQDFTFLTPRGQESGSPAPTSEQRPSRASDARETQVSSTQTSPQDDLPEDDLPF